MSQLNVDVIKNKAGTGGPTLQALTVTTGANVTGVVTASGFVGPVTGTATGLSGSPNITVSGVNNTGIATATEFDINGSSNSLATSGLVVNNINSTGVSTFATANITQSNPTNLNVSGITTLTGLVSVGSTIRVKGFAETQSTASVSSIF